MYAKTCSEQRGQLYIINMIHVYHTYVSLYVIHLFHVCMQTDAAKQMDSHLQKNCGQTDGSFIYDTYNSRILYICSIVYYIFVSHVYAKRRSETAGFATHCNTLQHTETHCNTLHLWWDICEEMPRNRGLHTYGTVSQWTQK